MKDLLFGMSLMFNIGFFLAFVIRKLVDRLPELEASHDAVTDSEKAEFRSGVPPESDDLQLFRRALEWAEPSYEYPGDYVFVLRGGHRVRVRKLIDSVDINTGGEWRPISGQPEARRLFARMQRQAAERERVKYT